MQRKCIAASLILFLFFVIGLAAAPSAEAAVLAGSWQYRAGVPGAELSDDENLAVHAGQSADWDSFTFSAQPQVLPGQQEIWLTTRVTGDAPDQNMLLFATTGQAVRVWLGARLIYADGEFQSMQPFGHGSKWHMVLLPAASEETQLTFQFYADYPYQLGRFDDFTLGSTKDQTLRLFAYDIPYVVTLPVAVMIIMILIMYAFNQAAWKRLNINVIIMLAMMSLWMISVSNVKQLFLDWPVFWYYIARIMMYLLPIAGNMIIYEVVENDLKPKVRLAVSAYAVLAVLAMLAEGLGLNGLDRCRVAFYALIPAAQIPVFYCMIVSIRRQNVYTRFAMIPMLGLSLLGVLDGVFAYLHLYPWHIYLAPLSVYTYVAFVVFMLREQLTRERQLREHEIGLKYEIALAIERSEVDVLTNCRNRGAFEDFMRERLSNTKDIHFSLVMMDIDCFKSVNDRFGHDAGDVVLKKITALIRSRLDKMHPFFRWGGEEFVIYCPEMGLPEAVELAESFRQLVEQTEILPEKRVTISAGVAFWHGLEDSSVNIFKRMDDALYRAKRNGRNTVATETLDESGGAEVEANEREDSKI